MIHPVIRDVFRPVVSSVLFATGGRQSRLVSSGDIVYRRRRQGGVLYIDYSDDGGVTWELDIAHFLLSEDVIQVTIDDSPVGYRDVVRDGAYKIDHVLTGTGFTGTEGTDWENIASISTPYSYWTSKLYDSGTGSSLNVAKWTVTNPEPLVSEFEQDESIIMHTLFATNADPYANNIKSTDSRNDGCWMFSLCDVRVLAHPDNGNSVTQKWYSGLIDATNQNGIRFSRITANAALISYQIIQGGVVKYTFNTAIENYFQPKIVITESHDISVYFRINDLWVQQGTTQNYDLGNLSLFMSSGGTYGSKTSLSDIFILDADTDEIPTLAHSAIDVRTYGAIPDGVTDSAASINSALLVGNVIIQNGKFLLSESIKIPSNRTVYIRNAKIKLADTIYDNFLRNSDFVNGNTSVNVIGIGNAVFDGNSVNNLDGYATYGPTGYPHSEFGYRYFGICLCNVTNYQVKGITVVDHSHWMCVFEKTSNGLVENIYQDMLTVGNYNQDGYVLIYDNHDIIFNKLRGRSGDDFLTLSVARNGTLAVPIANYTDGDLYNVTFNNIYCYRTGHRGVFMGGERNNLIHDLTFSNYKVHTSDFFMSSSLGVTQIAPLSSEVMDVTFDDIEVAIAYDGSNTGLFWVQQNCMDFTFTNFVNNTGKNIMNYISDAQDPIDIQNFTINGVLYPPPHLSTIVVNHATKNQILLTFTREMDDTSIPATTDFTPSGGKTVTNVAVNKIAKTVTLTVDTEYAYGDVITLDYTTPVSNGIKRYLAGYVDSFTGTAVTNNIVEGFPSTGIVGKWDMIGDLTDSSGNGYDLTNNNGVLTTDELGTADRAYDLVPASSAWVSRDPFTESQLIDEFTAACWFKVDTLANLNLFMGNTAVANYVGGWGLTWHTGNLLRFWVASWNGAAKAEVSFTDTTDWHFAIMSYKKTATAGQQLRFKLDDGSIIYGTYSANLGFSSCIFEAGKRFGPAYDDCKIGRRYLWNRELTDSEFDAMRSYRP